MSSGLNKMLHHAIGLAVALGGATLHAQSMQLPSGSQASGNAVDANRPSWIPYTRNGYIGLNLGRSNYGTSCAGLALRFAWPGRQKSLAQMLFISCKYFLMVEVNKMVKKI